MIQVIDFYAKGAHAAIHRREFSNLTFTTVESLEEVGFIPTDKSRKSSSALAHVIASSDGNVLALNGGHTYTVIFSDDSEIDVDASDNHQVINIKDSVKEVRSGDESVDVITD